MTDVADVVVQALFAAIPALALGVSVIAAVPAFVGLSQARKANKAASGANDLAAQANRIALNANEVSRRTEARATEPYDVEWTVGWVDEHHFFIANQGLDPAHNVRFRIGGPWGVGRHEGPQVVEPWTDFEVPCDATLALNTLDGDTVQLRIVWTSPAGTPHKAFLQIAGRDVFHHRRAIG